MVKREGGVTFIDTKDVISLEASDYYVKIITNTCEHLIRRSLNKFEEKLDPTKFVRIHRGTIINIDYIRQIEHFSNDEHLAIISNGKKYRISKSGRKRLDEKFRL
jgi:two-component system LytT family response regulator